MIAWRTMAVLRPVANHFYTLNDERRFEMPIVMAQRAVAGKHLWHDPRKRRCSLSSITSFARIADAAPGAPRYREVDYQEPAAALLARAVDTGAV